MLLAAVLIKLESKGPVFYIQERMGKIGKNGKPMGCESCHSTKYWKELDGFDHSTTSFPLAGAHRAVACIDWLERM